MDIKVLLVYFFLATLRTGSGWFCWLSALSVALSESKCEGISWNPPVLQQHQAKPIYVSIFAPVFKDSCKCHDNLELEEAPVSKWLCVFRSYNGWHRDAHSLRAWVLRWGHQKDLWLCSAIFKGCLYYRLLSGQVFTQRVCWPDSTVLQVPGSTGSGSLGSWFLCSLVWAMSTFCSGVWGPGPSESFAFLHIDAVNSTCNVASGLKRLPAVKCWPVCDGQILKGKVRAGKIDCQAHQHTCQSAGIGSYPSVRFYPYLGTQRVRPRPPTAPTNTSYATQEVRISPEARILQ